MADLPDWFAASVIKGLYGTELKTIQVDELGRLYAVLRALYGTTPKDVQCDASGNLTLNLKAQDLSEIINRPKYGKAQLSYAAVPCAANATTPILTVSGKGIIYAGDVSVEHTSTQRSSSPRLTVDGEDIFWYSFLALMKWRIPNGNACVGILNVYDDTGFIYAAGFRYGITFESSIALSYTEAHGSTPTVGGGLVYALI